MKRIKELTSKKHHCYYYGVLCYGTVNQRGTRCPAYHVPEVFAQWIQPANYVKTWWNQVEKAIPTPSNGAK